MGNFTDTFIRNLKPKAKRFEEYEGAGFGIRVTPTGLKTWVYRYKIDNKTDKLTLGHYPSMSLANAKKVFLELSSQRRDGKNPKLSILEQAEKKNHTVKNLILSWYSGYIEKSRKQPLHIKQQIDADIIPLFGHMTLDKIDPRTISKSLDTIVNRGSPVQANKVLSTLKQAFNYGVSRGDLVANPAQNIRARDIGGLEKPRERFLSLGEIKTLWIFLETDMNKVSMDIKTAIKIILLTGVRTSELRLAEWSEFNFDQSLWTIPASHSKNAISIKIHLSRQALTLLCELHNMRRSNYVLPSIKGDKPLTDKAIPRAIKRIQSRVGIPQWTAHDLRRTFATQLGETLNIDPVVIEKCLGHKMPKIMATYNKNEMLPQRREALDKWGRILRAHDAK